MGEEEVLADGLAGADYKGCIWTIKPNGYRQFNMAYVEIPKKNGKSELAAAVALLLLCEGNSVERYILVQQIRIRQKLYLM